MSKARPHAHIYEKWVRGIRQAIPNEGERCAVYEYIIAYQIAKVYNAAELPTKRELSAAAALALTMLEGDLEELCEARKENNERRKENGVRNIQSSATQTLADPSRVLQSNTIQDNNNTRQDKAIQDKAIQVAGNLVQPKVSIFDLGLSLLRCGYIVKADELKKVYSRASAASNPLAYAEKAGFTKCQAQGAGAPCANFVEETRCKDIYALELYCVKVEDGVLYVNCTEAAANAIGQAGTDNAMQYAANVGAKTIQYMCNGK